MMGNSESASKGIYTSDDVSINTCDAWWVEGIDIVCVFDQQSPVCPWFEPCVMGLSLWRRLCDSPQTKS